VAPTWTNLMEDTAVSIEVGPELAFVQQRAEKVA
jgi:hypothetical protein